MALTRKQREIAQRHELFLDIAGNLLSEEGFHLLTMERIAELAEYSKGTVYQHFSCKEEILIQLCINSMTALHKLFSRAAEFPGSYRDKIICIFYAHEVWTRNDKNAIDMLQHLSMHGVMDKVSAESQAEHDKLEHGLVGLVSSVVKAAMDAGELPKHKKLTPPEIVFGLWSMSMGGQLLQASDLPLQDFGVENPGLTLLRTVSATLDGYGWQPQHSESHFQKQLKKLEGGWLTTNDSQPSVKQ